MRALCKLSGGKLNAGNEKPAAAAACNDCNNAAECSCALRRNSATDVVRGSCDDTVDTLFAFVIAVERLALNDEIDDAADDVIGQHEHKPGNPIIINEKFNSKNIISTKIKSMYFITLKKI